MSEKASTNGTVMAHYRLTMPLSAEFTAIWPCIASDYGSEGWGFESLQAHQIRKDPNKKGFFIYLVAQERAKFNPAVASFGTLGGKNLSLFARVGLDHPKATHERTSNASNCG